MKKEEKVKKTVSNEQPVVSQAAQVTKSLENTLDRLDQDLRKYAMCSMFSMNLAKVINTVSICYQAQVFRDLAKSKKKLTKMEESSLDYMCATVIGSYLGPTITDN